MKREEIKMRGFIFSTVYYPYASGAEIAVKEITDRLPGYEWDLITARVSSELPLAERRGSVTIHRVGIGHPTLDKFLLPITGFFRAWSLYRSGSHQIVWSMMASQASIPAAFLKIAFSRLRLVLTLQEGDEEEYLLRYVGGNQALYRIFIRPWHVLVFKKADYITALSRHLMDRARKNNPQAENEIIPNGVDLSIFKKAEHAVGEGSVVLVTTSRLVEKNDPESVIRALPLLPPRVHFWIVGCGVQEEYLKTLVEELGLSSRVVFLGQLDHVEIAGLFTKAHIFIRPSLSEGLGSSFLEAMAAGLPIIATPVGGIPDFLENNETGIFVEVKNPPSIARAVERLISDPVLYSRISEKGARLAREKYDWANIAEVFSRRAFRVDTASHPRVLIAASIYPPDGGGPATHAKHAFEDLPGWGVETRLVTFRSVRIFPPGMSHAIYFAKLFLAAFRVEAIYAYDALSAGFPAALVARILRKRFIVRIGGDRLWERAYEKNTTRDSMAEFYASGAAQRFFAYRIIRWVLGRADRLVVPSPATLRLYHAEYGVPLSRIAVIYNPVRAASDTMPPEMPPTLLFSSRLTRYKNLPFVLRSLSVLKKEGLSFVFLVLGDGPERESLEAMVRELDLEDSVNILGYVSSGEVHYLTKKSYASIAPALTEFHPNYVLDGISHGKPFLISRENALPFQVPEMFLFDPTDHAEFEEKLRFLLSPHGWNKAEAELREIKASFSWEDNIRENSLLIKRLCGY